MLGGGIESLPEGAVVVPVGADGLVMPWPHFRATGSQMARIEVAAMLGLAGLVFDDEAMTAERRRLLGEVEAEMAREAKRRLKIPEGRAVRAPADVDIEEAPIALVPAQRLGLPATWDEDGGRYTPAPLRSREPVRAPIMEKFDRVAAVEPASARLDTNALNDTQRKLLQQADAKLASAEARKEGRRTRFGHSRMTQAERDERRFAQSAYQQLGLTLLAKEQQAEVDRGFAETARLETARGEQIEGVATEFGMAMKITSRDGLASLEGVLTPLQGSAADWYRDLYARTERGARIAQMGAVVSGVDDKRKAKEWGADQIARKAVEAKVMAASKNGRGLQALRLVVGQGRTIRSLAPNSGANQALYRKALLVALDVVADHRGLQ